MDDSMRKSNNGQVSKLISKLIRHQIDHYQENF